MAVEIIEYKFVGEIKNILQHMRESNMKRLFLAPSSTDRQIMRGILADSGSADRVLLWNDLYMEIRRISRLVNGIPKRQIDPPDNWLILKYILNELFNSNQHVEFPPAVRLPGFIDMLGGQIRELINENVIPDLLRRMLGCQDCDGFEKCGHVEPVKILCRLYSAYMKYLDKNNLMDSAGIAGEIECVVREDSESLKKHFENIELDIVGFMSFTHSQLSLVRRLSSLGMKIRMLKPASGMNGFYDASEQLGKNISRVIRDTRVLPAKVWKMTSGVPRMEAENLARILAMWRVGHGPLAEMDMPKWEDIGIFIDRGRLPFFVEAMNRYGIRSVARNGKVVEGTHLWDIACKIIRAKISGWHPIETADLLSEPCFCGGFFKRGDALKDMPYGEESWRKVLKPLGRNHSECFEMIIAFAKKMQRGGTPRSLLMMLHSLAKEGNFGMKYASLALNEPSLDHVVMQMNAAILELEKKILFMEELLPAIGAAGDEELSGASAWGFVSRWAETSSIKPEEPKKGAVNLYEGEVPVLMEHSVFIITGTTSKTWPGSVREAVLLGEKTREALNNSDQIPGDKPHLPLIGELRQRREVLFRRMIAAGRVLTICSRAEIDEKERPLFFPRFLVDEKNAERNIWIEIAGEECRINLSSIILTSSEPRFENEIYDGQPKTYRGVFPREARAPSSSKGSISALDDFNDCAYRYWCKDIAMLGDSASAIYDTVRAGKFLHALWERVFDGVKQGKKDIAMLAAEIWGEMVSTDDGYPELEKDPRLIRQKIDLRYKVKRLAGMAEKIDAVISGKRKDILLESSFEMEMMGVLFRGRIDRIDVLADSGYILYDYKLGKAEKKGKSLQLPAYCVISKDKQVGGYVILPSGYCYLGHGDGKACFVMPQEIRDEMEPLQKKKKEQLSLEDMIVSAEDAMKMMAWGVSKGEFRAFYNSESCNICKYKTVCRRSEDRGERKTSDEEGGETE